MQSVIYIEKGIMYQMFGFSIEEVSREIDMLSLGLNGIAEYIEECRNMNNIFLQDGEFLSIEEDINL